jgi:hypothetical protein
VGLYLDLPFYSIGLCVHVSIFMPILCYFC